MHVWTSAGLRTPAQVLTNLSAATGYAFSVGYVDAELSFGLGSGPRSLPGLTPVVPGTVGPHDTMGLGSGSKPYVGAPVDQPAVGASEARPPHAKRLSRRSDPGVRQRGCG